MTGYFAKSQYGHDKNRVYIIIEEKDNYYLVADGKYRTLDNPKKKNRKHVQVIKINNQFCNNEDIRQLVQSYEEGLNVKS